jgi:hypothetical protein
VHPHVALLEQTHETAVPAAFNVQVFDAQAQLRQTLPVQK